MQGRNVQVVATKSDRKRVTEWMIQEADALQSTKNIAGRAVQQFPQILRQPNRSARYAKAYQWWKTRMIFLQELTTGSVNCRMYVSSRGTKGCAVQKFPIKACVGRDRKRANCKLELHELLLTEFERLRSLQVKVARGILRDAAIAMIEEDDYSYSIDQLSDMNGGKPILEIITPYFVKDFNERFNIVERVHIGNRLLSPEVMLKLHKRIAYALGRWKNEFDNGLDPSTVENLDETHVVFDTDNNRVLDFRGAKVVKYSEVSSAGEKMTICLRITGGSASKIAPALMLFKFKNRNYPLQGLADNIEGLQYRTSPRAWMEKRIMNDLYRNETLISPLSNGRTRILCMDNCSAHKLSPEIEESLNNIQTEVRYVPENSTPYSNPLDQHIFRSFKARWKRKWENYKADVIMNNAIPNTEKYTSTGRVRNPGRRFYMELTRHVIDEMNNETVLVSGEEVSWARRSMIMCGMNPDVDVIWRVGQLTSELQNIVNQNLEFFNGQVPE